MQNMLHQKNKPSWTPPLPGSLTSLSETRHIESQAPKVEESISQSEEGFSRFYNTFGSLINKLSAPLAFAGLPLIAEEPATESSTSVPEPPVSNKGNRMKASVMAEPELSRIYSKATLEAIRGGPSESFLIVPKTGGTASYANILSYDKKEQRRMAASLQGDDDSLAGDLDEDDFVVAVEQALPPSPAFKQRLGRGHTDKELRNVIEELHTENVALKDTLDKLSKRLHAFEANAQNSHIALQESMRFMRPSSPMSSSGGGRLVSVGGGDEALQKKNKELEEELARAIQQISMLEKENGRMDKNLKLYRDKWEKLKAGAKARREAQGSSDSNATYAKLQP